MSSHPSPSSLRLSSFQIPSTLDHQTLRIDCTSGLAISCLFCALRMHSIATRTRNNYVSLNPWRIRSLVFMVFDLLGHERFLGESMILLVLRAQIDSFRHHETLVFWIPTSYFPIVQAEQNELSIARYKCIEYYQLIAIHCVLAVPKITVYK